MAHTVDPAAPDSLPELGRELRVQRELREISLREVSEATKISVRFLEAIENDDYGTLPAPVFTRGFLKEYAKQLGLDPEEIVDRYMLYVAQQKRIEDEEEAEMIDRRLGPGSSFGGFEAILLVALVVVVIAAFGFFWLKRSTSEVPISVDSPPTIPAATAPVVAPPPVADEAAAMAVPSDDGLIRLRVTATSDSWVTLFVDGEKVLEETLRAGDERTFEATETIRFETVGNAGGLMISLDDHIIPPFGRTGQVVRNRVFDRDAIEELIKR